MALYFFYIIFCLQGDCSQLFLKRQPLVQEKVVAKGRWSFLKQYLTEEQNGYCIYKVVAYGKWSLQRVVVKRELTVCES